jgi:cysteinylglycine-S-conjugate dipeptidase
MTTREVRLSTAALSERIRGLMGQAWTDLAALVSYRSVADPRHFPVEECRAAAEFVAKRFTEAGIPDVRLIDTVDGSQAVFGHRPGPDGAPTVLLYSHYDVQPPLDASAWTTPIWTLTPRNGRWYGRGAADCKGNIVAQLMALEALGGHLPVGVTIVSDGAEEQGTDGLEKLIRSHPELLRADTILICDTGNVEVGQPTVTTDLRGMVNAVVTVRALTSAMHSGMFGGPTPDPLVALIHMLATLHDARGNTTIHGLDNDQRWPGAAYPDARFRTDANVLPGVDLLGSGSVADMLWARPSATVLGIDCPSVAESAPAIQAQARARVSLRVPTGMDNDAAAEALAAHLRAAARWNVEVDIDTRVGGRPFRARTDGPAYHRLMQAMAQAYGREPTTAGQGGSIPVCQAFHETFPDAEILLIGVEEPQCLIHAPDESVDPSEIERIALSQAIFLATA